MESNGIPRNVSWGENLEYYVDQNAAIGGDYHLDESSDDDDDDQEYDSVSSRSTISTPLLTSSFARLMGIADSPSSSSDSSASLIEQQPLQSPASEQSSVVTIKPEKTFWEFMTRDKINLYCLMIFYVVYILLYGLLVPQLFITYVFAKYPDRSDKDNNAAATRLKSVADALPYLVFFLVGPVMGAFSDKYGRKKTFFISTFCYFIDAFGYLATLKTNNLIYFYVGHAIGGFAQSIQSNSMSYLADVTTPLERTKAYGFSGGCAGLGVLLGPAASIFLSSLGNLYYNVYAVLGILGICLALNITLPESIHRAPITAPKVKRTLNPFKACWKLLSNSRYLCFVALIYASYTFTSQDTISTSFMYTRIRYNWSAQTFSTYMVFLGVAFVFWNVIVVPFATKRICKIKLYCKSPTKGDIKKAVSSDDLTQSIFSKHNGIIGINVSEDINDDYDINIMRNERS
ncbi:putative transport transmembrane protein [Cavenderia fasciculata]|uniref:Transport transmembrane protein n=1 Tax=Cavenderia fasciculata TaxID=261658 RepID=F4Q0H3_CACFS|nr:putative transport transmembrane protein [Cavenderia fasciculata]EGG18324.1 putative transport transmembrane protein [Cavenderia fasciculata]|eukprot:XP_004366228.1 putative transport transmembrane protein [Cavenderia fasciculata]